MQRPSAIDEKKPIRVEIRPYTPAIKGDDKWVQYLFYSTYYDVVPRAVRLRLTMSPIIPSIWLGLFAIVFRTTLVYLDIFGFSGRLKLVAQIFIVLTSIAIGLLGLLWYVDKFDITERVLSGLENDLLDPYKYYTHGKFWILLVNGNIAGCIGIDFKEGPIVDVRSLKEHKPAVDLPDILDASDITTTRQEYVTRIKTIVKDAVRIVIDSVCERIHKLLVKLRVLSSAKQASRILFKRQEKKEASIRRLAVRTEYQGFGFSNALINCAIRYAQSNGAERVVAETNELQTKMASILENQHQFKLYVHERQSLYHTSTTWKLDLSQWNEKETTLVPVPEEQVD